MEQVVLRIKVNLLKTYKQFKNNMINYLIMLFSIESFFKNILILVLLNDYLKNNFSEKYNQYIIQFSYNIIYLYSKSQIIVRKLRNKIEKQLYNYSQYFKEKNPIIYEIIINFYKDLNSKLDIEFILDGKPIFSTSKKYILSDFLDLTDFPPKYDFIIFSDYNNITTESTCINKKIMLDLPREEKDFVCEESKIKFVLSEFYLEDKIIMIDFKNENRNYYINNNIFNSNFLKYFIFKYYNEDIQDINWDNFNDFKLKIIDHQISSIEIDNLSSIKIGFNGYEKIYITN